MSFGRPASRKSDGFLTTADPVDLVGEMDGGEELRANRLGWFLGLGMLSQAQLK